MGFYTHTTYKDLTGRYRFPDFPPGVSNFGKIRPDRLNSRLYLLVGYDKG
jgi:hypothetical protein